MLSNSFTECCVGLRFNSCGSRKKGTNVTCTNVVLVATQLLAHLADGLMKGSDSMFSHRTPHLNDGDVDILRHLLHGRFDFHW